MRKFITLLLFLLPIVVNSSVLYPGNTTIVSFEPTTGEYGPQWTTTNPTLQLSYVGFTCKVTAQAYFGGTATVTCTYSDRIGNIVYTRKRNWSFTCIDTQISISPTSKSLKVNETFQISCGFNNTTYITPIIQYTGYDNNIVSVSNYGVVTGKSVGETNIYVKSNIGTNSVICKVKVSGSGGGLITETISSYDNWDSSKTTTIILEEAGTLADYITDDKKYKITDLTIVGPLNGADLRLLRDMAGRDVVDNKMSSGKLEILDLKDAFFVSGGPWFIEPWDGIYYYTSGTYWGMPSCSFRWCDKLKKIRFPKYCKTISNGGTLHCNSLEYIAIPPGVIDMDRDFLCGGWEDFAMRTISLPSSLVDFNTEIFNCENLTDVYCYAITPPNVKYPNSFKTGANFSDGTLFVPKGCSSAYWQAPGWRNFRNIKETLDVFNTLYVYVGENGRVVYNKNIIEKKKQNLILTGYQAFEIPSTQDVVVQIIPNDGYSVAQILLDDKVYESSQNINEINLGKLTKHSTLKVNFEVTTDIKNFRADMDINITDTGLVLLNSERMTVAIYGSNGALVENIDSYAGEEIALDKGVYILRVSDKVVKVKL